MKKLLAFLLAVLCMVSLFCGCDKKEEKEEIISVSQEQKEESVYPTADEALEYIKERYYDESTWNALNSATFSGPNNAVITATKTCVLYRKGGIMNAIYYDNGFSSFVASNSDITSAWDDISAFFEEYLGLDLDLTAETLESNMQYTGSLSASQLYAYEHNGFNYSIQTNQSGVTITVKE